MKKMNIFLIFLIPFAWGCAMYPRQTSENRKDVPSQFGIFKTTPKPISIGKYYYLHDFDGKKLFLIREDTSIIEKIREHVQTYYGPDTIPAVVLKGTTIDPLTLYTRAELRELPRKQYKKLIEITDFKVVSITQEPEFVTMLANYPAISEKTETKKTSTPSPFKKRFKN